MPEPIISVSGLRGIVGESLTPEVALRFACAFAAEIPPGPIVITRDGRATGRMLADAIRSGLQATGRDVIDADVAATPTTGVLVRHVQAAGGIQISASHNPSEYNGLKLFSSAGQVISAAEGQKVIARYRSGEPNWVLHGEVGTATTCLDPDSPHKVLVEKTVNLARLQGAHFNVLLDSNHGAGSDLGSILLESLGCRVTVLGGEPDGKFEHLPEPTAANLSNVLNRVPQTQAHIGFCQDPDADRLAIIDEKGRYIGEEYTLALVVDHLLRQRKGPVVTNCSTSQMAEELAKKYRVPFYRSAVGEANVVALMQAKQALIGGEGNGGVIDPRVGYVRDSFVGMALILDAMAAREKTISELADELPRFEIHKTTVKISADKAPAGFAALEKHFKSAKPDHLDGLRLDWPGKWLLIRASNTEPIVRAVAEAPTAEEARQLCNESAEILGRYAT